MQRRKQILFFCAATPSIISYKIAKELRKEEYETVLMAMCNRERIEEDFFKEAFDKIFYSNFQFSKPSLRYLFYALVRLPFLLIFLIRLKLIKPYVVIGTGNNWQLMQTRKYFFNKTSFIYFPYDLVSHYSGNPKNQFFKPSSKEVNAEKYNFENSNGIIHKGDPDELKSLEGRWHKKINFSKLQSNFNPYCSDDFIVPINKNKLSKKDKEFHTVYIGNFYYGDTLKKIYNFLEQTSKQKIHVHIYAFNDLLSKKKDNELIFSAFKPYLNSKYFHLHKVLGPKKIAKEISKYDFGINFSYTHDSDTIEPTYSMGNKFASYYEAGLPTINDSEIKFVGRTLKHHGTGIDFNEKTLLSLNKILKKLDYKKMEKNIEIARQEFNIKKHIKRFIKFIERVKFTTYDSY